jgi:RimJ/RimL family protein N-acetyltransferase
MVNFKLVNNEPKYYEFIRTLRNDERVKIGFIQSSYITQKQQLEYMSKYRDCFRICLNDDDTPVGYVGVIDDDIRIATDPSYQKQGVGKFMLQQIKTIFPNSVAKIKLENEASLKLFLSSGFKVKYYLLERE